MSGLGLRSDSDFMNSVEDRQSKIAAGVLLHNDEKWEG
jgi:hypothetical protein